MLLKPATPLTLLLLVAFALLLLSCLSTPIIRGIPLASYDNVDYGVFGYCHGNKCSSIHVGYLSSDINTNGSKNNFKLPSSARKSLSEILIVHPVAAFLTLICLFMAIAAHFHAPSHSPRFLLTLLILFLPTLLVSLLAFLVDILLFIPHLQWGGWIVLVATVILVSCGVVTCAMRRTLVSRKARKHRIAENAEMSGENFYNRQNAAANVAAQEPSMPNIETKEAIVSGSSEPGPTFAAFRTNTRTSDDDRTPLNLGPLNDIPPPDRRGTPYSGPTDEAGNLMPPGPYGAGPSDPRMRQYSDGSIGSWRGGGPPPPGFGPRGRGAYPPRGGYGRGGPHMGPRGPPPPGARGGYMGPRGRGGMMRGRGPPRGPPPDGYDSYGRPMPSPGGDPYGSDPYGAGAPPPTGPPRQQTPGPIGMAFSDPELVDQAIEMTPQNRHLSDPSMDPGPHALSIDGQHMPLESPTSQYSRPESYVPARAGWGPSEIGQTLSPHNPPSPLNRNSTASASYYEDVDPRFARRPSNENNASVPSSLTPGSHM